MQIEKIDSYINFAVRANKVVWGLDMLKTSKKIPYVIIYDKALGASSKKQLLKYSSDHSVDAIELQENHLNNLLKRDNVKIIGVIDESLSKAIKENWL